MFKYLKNGILIKVDRNRDVDSNLMALPKFECKKKKKKKKCNTYT